MTRRDCTNLFSLVLALAGCTSAVGLAAERNTREQTDEGSARRPNIVLIMADDVGSEVLGCYGGTSYQTPNIDALARTGMTFHHCYSMPVCHPTRMTIMTGRYPFRNPAAWGKWPKGVATFAQVLQTAGYATAVAGKWQLTLFKNNPRHARELGFDQSALFGWHEGPRYHNPMIYRNGVVWQEKQRPDVYGPEVYAEFLIEFMKRNRNRPFLAYYPMALCHEISDDFSPVPPPAPDGHYLSFTEMVADMDRMVGRVVAALDDMDLRKNTVIIFTTDNGSPVSYLTGVKQQGDKIVRSHKPVISIRDNKEVRGGKGKLTDAGTRVPLIVNWPGTTPVESTCDDLVDFSDVLPTLVELAGARLSSHVALDGHSFAPQARGQAGQPRRWVYCQHQGKRWVRNKRWKLYQDGRFYDVQSDPAERSPLGGEQLTPEAAQARAELSDALASL